MAKVAAIESPSFQAFMDRSLSISISNCVSMDAYNFYALNKAKILANAHFA
jgi:hypothetical protein